MALDPALSFEGVRHDIDPEMGLPARPVPGMAFVLMGFVHHLEALRREGFGQLSRDDVGGVHAAELGKAASRGQSLHCGGSRCAMPICQVLKASLAGA